MAEKKKPLLVWDLNNPIKTETDKKEIQATPEEHTDGSGKEDKTAENKSKPAVKKASDKKKKATYHLPYETRRNIARASYWERKDQWEVISDALKMYMEGKNYEKAPDNKEPEE